MSEHGVTPVGHLVVGGEKMAGSGEPFTSTNPSTGNIVWSGQAASVDQVRQAVQRAKSALPSWARLSHDERKAFLGAFAELANSRKSDIAQAISSEVGKPYWESLTEAGALSAKLVPTVAAQAARAATSEQQVGSGWSVTRYRPLGPVAVLGPYNFPVHMPNGHVMPALLAGNTVIFKPSERSPMVGELYADLWLEAGLPPGVFNMVHGGADVASHLIEDDDVRGIFLTGSPAVGKTIMSQVPFDSGKVVALELGGNSPMIVWDYDDVKSAVITVVQSTFITSGQRCSAARRLILNNQDTAFVSELTRVLKGLRVGPPDDLPEPYMGPVISNEHADLLLVQQNELIEAGGQPLLKMKRIQPDKPFLSPGLIDMTHASNRPDIEVFGPILQIVAVSTFEDALREANSTKFGLAAGLLARDRSLYERFVAEIDAGVLSWNQQLTGASALAPFGGTKASGNHNPGGFLAVDYCVVATGAMEAEHIVLPQSLPPGLSD